ncbi:MAG: PEP-utilizing enzyme, partial [Vampirovibrionia bacterium]
HLDDTGTLQNDLLIGQGDIISTQPIKNIREMSNIICKDDKMTAFFINNDEAYILDNMRQFPELCSKFNQHIDKFGDRCISELKLETITYRHKPDMLILLLKSYVQAGYVDQDILNQKELDLKHNAESKVHQSIKNNYLRKLLFKFILSQTRLLVRNRENLRFERTRVFAQIREIFLAIADKFYYESIIEDQKDIFYLTKEELFSFINGSSVSTDLKQLIKLRKDEFASYEALSLPDRFETYGSPYHANIYEKKKKSIDDANLSGVACSPGIVKARVKVVKTPTDVEGLTDSIMVAERTDPGWAPLFPLVKGLLIQRGSLLSHSAIVAREMGIPAIVSIDSLLETLKDGDIVEMDGSTGLIKKI